ncbi:MAG: zinc-ribbon domain-containing protein, partial [Actinobacteria bacterium]|nr:zinc-ribbon domain-containing protein [Actinomycetota bacterium]
MNCPHCSKEISDTAKVCGYCGTRLAAAPPPPAPAPAPEEPP